MRSCARVLIATALIIIHECYAQFQVIRPLMQQNLPEDGKLNFTQLARKYGKRVEEFEVITEDGYILGLFHVIPETKRNSPPILLQHGVADCADNFVVRGKTSLSMTLASAGYDVWVGNTRGNRYGRRHLRLDPDRDVAFWNFSLQENGYYDVAASVNFVLDKTGWKTLNAIAHSQGTTDFFVLGATRPEYNKKINILIALAPVAFLHHSKPPVSSLIKSASLINLFLKTTGQEELLADQSLNKGLLEFICTQEMMSYEICAHGVLFALGGSDPSQLEKEFLHVIVGHYPQGTSRKQLLHLAQIAQRKRFAQFDYGAQDNLKRYNYTTPPDYNLSNVTMKVALLVSRNDPISTLKDVRLLKKQLPNVVEYLVMEPPKWNHLDWVWGLKMGKYLYPHILNFLEKYK